MRKQPSLLRKMQRSNKAVAQFYNSKQWHKVRSAYKLYRHNICERCGGIGYIVHHKCYIDANNIYNTEVTLNFDNLELLCMDCHNKEHFEQNDFTDNGQLKVQDNDILELVKVYKK